MADIADNRSTEILQRAEKFFTGGSVRCQALCRDLRATAAQLEEAEVNGASEERIAELNARYLAISQSMDNLGCAPCHIF